MVAKKDYNEKKNPNKHPIWLNNLLYVEHNFILAYSNPFTIETEKYLSNHI